MNDGDKHPHVAPGANENLGSAGLPYIVEIWNLPRTHVERVIARADTILVARAVFDAAAAENPSRRVVLRQADRVLAELG